MNQTAPYNQNWEFLTFPSLDQKIPSVSLQHELVLPTTANSMFRLNLFHAYNQEISSSLENGLEINIDSNLGIKLYVIDSLRRYSFPDQHNDFKSLKALRICNNNLISAIRKSLQSSSQFNELEENFCNNNGMNYLGIQYHKAIVEYCHGILPYPLNFVSNIDKDGEMSIHYREAVIPTKTTLIEYQERKIEAERRTAALFTEYRYSRFVLGEFAYLIMQEHPEISLIRSNLNDETVSNNRRLRNSRRPIEKDMLLHRCEFCYRFRLEQRKRGNKPAWHCHRERCKQQYRKWINHLNNKKGINLKA